MSGQVKEMERGTNEYNTSKSCSYSDTFDRLGSLHIVDGRMVTACFKEDASPSPAIHPSDVGLPSHSYGHEREDIRPMYVVWSLGKEVG